MLRTHRRTRIAVAAPLLAVLAGCGALAALLPDFHFNDPFKLNNRPVTLPITAGAAGGPSTFTGQFSTEPLPHHSGLPINPARLIVNETLLPTLTITASGGTPPATITLTNLTLAISATSSTGQTAAIPTVTLVGPLVLTRTSSGIYTVSSTSIVLPPIDTGSQTGNIINVITSNGTYTAKVVVGGTLNSSPELPTGSTLTFNFGSATGTLKF